MTAFRFLVLGIIAISLTACQKKEAAPHGGGGFATPVVGVKVTPAYIEETVPVVGSLAANEVVEIKSEIDGPIQEIKFEEGQMVKKGDVLIVMDAAKLNAALAEAEANAGIVQTTFNRMKALVESGAVSKQEFDQISSDVAAKNAAVDLIKAQVEDARIIAPFDGVIASREVSVGQFIAKDTLLTVIIDGDPMKADFRVPERYIGRLKEGQSISLVVAAYPDEKFEGEVYFIDPQVDETSRTVLVKAKIPNPEGKLRRGMFAKLDLTIGEKSDALVIPEIALIPKGEEVFVFTVDGEGKAQMNSVKTGVRKPGVVEIVSGLKAGDTVITEGYQKIGPGSPVNVSFPAS